MDRPRRSRRVEPTGTPYDSRTGSQQPADAAGPSGAPTSSSGPAKLHRYKPYPAVADASAIRTSFPSHPGATWPLGPDAMPSKPQTPVGPGQAMHTTFPSRMRTGVSTLMQPLPAAESLTDTLISGRGGGAAVAPLIDHHATGSRRSGRGAQQRRVYVEESSDIEEDDDDEDGEGGAAGAMASATASPRGQSLLPGGQGSSSRGTPIQPGPTEQPERPGERLGQPPPANKIFVKRAGKTPHSYFSESDLSRAAGVSERLIPIRIELITDTHRVKDCFTWNANERLFTPSTFVRIFLQDLDLPYDVYGPQLEASILQQIEDWNPISEIQMGPAAGGVWACREPDLLRGEKRKADIEDEREKRKDARSWNYGIEKQFRRFIKASGKEKQRLLEDRPDETVEGQDGEWEDDLRVISNYDVQILHHTLRDRLEWDLSSPLTPEAFAAQTCKEIGLSNEALPIISVALREELLNHKRAVAEHGLIGLGSMWGQAIEDEERALRRIQDEKLRRKMGLLSPGINTSTRVSESPMNQRGAPTLEVPGASSPLGPLSSSVTPRGPTPSNTGDDDDEAPTSELTEETELPPKVALAHARAAQDQLNNVGPRRLLAPWRDWFESKECGPILEYLGEEELEKREGEMVRELRRKKREIQRDYGGGGPGGNTGYSKYRERDRRR